MKLWVSGGFNLMILDMFLATLCYICEGVLYSLRFDLAANGAFLTGYCLERNLFLLHHITLDGFVRPAGHSRGSIPILWQIKGVLLKAPDLTNNTFENTYPLIGLVVTSLRVYRI